ncbi:MAG TPA: CoA transferase [Burkholderiales bacterium]|nr:CoA transferase [Burkholderiales bacterium]
MSAAMGGAMSGVVVLDLTRFLSGPHCTLLLAGLGAEVIKIDDPGTGDPAAGAPPYAGPQGVALERRSARDFGIAYLKRARGKKSVTLNLKSPEGRSLFLGLVEKADAVVENFRPGVAERLGIGYEALRERNPRLVYCALSGFGATGPERAAKAYDLMTQAAVGLMSVTGPPQGAPSKTGTQLSDTIAGTYAALGVASALLERERSGEGQMIDVSMADCLFSMMMDEPLDCYEALGLAPRQGNRIMRFSPFNTYAARDGWVAIGAVSLADWHGILKVIERPELCSDVQMNSVEWRIAHNEGIDALISTWTRERPVAEIVAALARHDVPCSPVRTPREAIDWPQLRARDMVQPLQSVHGEDTEVVAAGFPLKFSRSAGGHGAPAPVPGRDTASVLGLTEGQFRVLRDRGVV